jgi:methylthioribose-1-phosphate isomerase
VGESERAGFETLAWRGEAPGGVLELIDQRALPGRHELLRVDTVQGAWDAIKTLAVRGAPAIGVAAGYGVVLGAQAAHARGEGGEGIRRSALAAADHLASSRPTAVNLFWALERMRRTLERLVDRGVGGERDLVLRALLVEARAIHDEDRATCRAIGRHGAALLPHGARVLTHCNAGGLATSEYGTALGVIYAAVEGGNPVSVLSCETRPLLQGARLTTWELRRREVPVTMLTDGMAAFAMQRGKIDAVVVGADRIARNGDAANKIGTYAHAVAAREHGVPFYVAAPRSTFDLSLASGDAIPIEERGPDEVTTFAGTRIAPEGVDVWNPAFDVTPARLITAIICEQGVIQPVDEAHVTALVGGPRGWC